MEDLIKAIATAIETGQNLGIQYQGFSRLVTPYLLGETKDRRLVLHGFQYGGESSKGSIDRPEAGGWRFFYLDTFEALAMGPGPSYPEDLQKSEGEYMPPNFITAILAHRS